MLHQIHDLKQIGIFMRALYSNILPDSFDEIQARFVQDSLKSEENILKEIS